MDVITALASRVAASGISKVASDIYAFLKKKSSNSILIWRAEKGVEDLYQRIESVRQVKTIWQIDHSVDLQEFYCPPHLLVDTKRIRVDRLSEIPGEYPLLIEGIAGQGKSTFLRYICSQEMILGTSIPVFIELRKIGKDDSILTHAARFLELLGIELTDDLVKALLKEGKLTLYLDGFDEVSEEAKRGVIHDIEYLSQIRKGKHLVVTSRPNSCLRNAAHLSVIKMDNLKKNEYKEVVYKISDTREYADSLLTLIEAHKGNIKNLLCTPLLVTLLVVSYKSYQQLPTRLSDFYNALFQVLLQRHDGSKPNFVRIRESGLNDSLFRTAFDNLCFQTKRLWKESFAHDEMFACAKSAIEVIPDMNVAPESFLMDVVDITCLVVRDGEEFRFIHKSVQEFFVASYVREKPEKFAAQFYQRIVKNGFKYRWTQELQFLEEIDQYRFYKFFLIPQIKQLLNITSTINNAPPISTIAGFQRNILDPYTVTIQRKTLGDDGADVRRFSASIEIDETLVSAIPSVVFRTMSFCLHIATEIEKKHPDKLSKFENAERTSYVLPLKQVALLDEVKTDVKKFIKELVADLIKEGKVAEEYLRTEEKFLYENELFDDA